MHAGTNLRFERCPSQMGLFITALRNSSPRKREPAKALSLRASWHSIHIDSAHRAAFHNACGLAQQAGTSILYPMSWMYPLMMRMLSDRAAPMPLFYVLNTRMQLQQHLPLPDHGRFNMDLSALAVRKVDKGLEFDIGARLHGDGALVWECLMTMFYRGRFDGPSSPVPPKTKVRLKSVDAHHAWRLQDKGGLRFGRLCGDTNPIHYGKTYAKAFGFERDFAQPLLVIGQALSHLPDFQTACPPRLEARLKGPVYYGREVKMLVENSARGRRFDLYCEPNTKPSICVELSEPV